MDLDGIGIIWRIPIAVRSPPSSRCWTLAAVLRTCQSGSLCKASANRAADEPGVFNFSGKSATQSVRSSECQLWNMYLNKIANNIVWKHPKIHCHFPPYLTSKSQRLLQTQRSHSSLPCFSVFRSLAASKRSPGNRWNPGSSKDSDRSDRVWFFMLLSFIFQSSDSVRISNMLNYSVKTGDTATPCHPNISSPLTSVDIEIERNLCRKSGDLRPFGLHCQGSEDFATAPELKVINNLQLTSINTVFNNCISMSETYKTYNHAIV